MTDTPIFADFQNADPLGRVRLNTVGTVEDLSRHGVRLREGLRLVLRDDDMEADGVVNFSSDERVWVAQVDWDAIRRSPAPETRRC